MSTIKLEFRKEKIDKDGQAPIRLIYQIRGQRVYYSTGQKTYSENWDSISQKVVYKKKGLLSMADVKKANDKLSDIIRLIEKIENRFEANGTIYSPQMIMQALKNKDVPVTKKDTSSKELFSFIEKYINDNKFIRVHGSLSVYKSLKKHLQEYEKKAGAKITFEKIDYAFFQSFQNFLVSLTKKDSEGKTIKALNNITIAKQLSTLKTFLNYAKIQGVNVSEKYRPFKIKRETDLEVIALTQDEFDRVYDLDLSQKKHLEQVRDCFIFSCVTAFRFSDLKQLRREHIKIDHLEITQIKTGHKVNVPLNQYSQEILKKYEKNILPLPVISNQKSNKHLNEICKLAGVDEKISIVRKYGAARDVKIYPKYELVRMHCGRKTFATLSLKKGMAAERVMRLGGWTDYKSFQRYINITKDDAKEAMEVAWGAIRSELKAV